MLACSRDKSIMDEWEASTQTMPVSNRFKNSTSRLQRLEINLRNFDFGIRSTFGIMQLFVMLYIAMNRDFRNKCSQGLRMRNLANSFPFDEVMILPCKK